jgi:translation initiation factor 2B subunit (eIF-2B alpha/beta/delta family)
VEKKMINKYEAIHESLQEKVNTGELTLEDAEKVDTLAYEKYADVYLKEAKDDVKLAKNLADAIDDGKVVLTDDNRKCIEDLLKSVVKGNDSEGSDDKDDKKDDEPEETEPEGEE